MWRLGSMKSNSSRLQQRLFRGELLNFMPKNAKNRAFFIEISHFILFLWCFFGTVKKDQRAFVEHGGTLE